MDELWTVEGVVTTDHVGMNAYLAWSKEVDKLKIIIDYEYCPPNVSLVGKWARMRIDCKFRVREMVSIIDDMFPTRIVNELVEIRANFQHHGNYRDQFEMFTHDYFGFICDPRHVISRIEQGSWYTAWIVAYKEEDLKSRWRVSTKQDNISPQSRILEKNSQGLELVDGIVHSYAKSNDSYFAWSKKFPKTTIRVDFSFCPPGDILGRWIEMEIDDKNRVQRNVRVLRDCFQTRVRSGITEIRIDFQHIRRVDNAFEMFFHEYFGNIYDCKFVMDVVENGAWYNGWIVYHKQDGIQARWRIATAQCVEGPLKPKMQNDRERVLSPVRSIRGHSPIQSRNTNRLDDDRCDREYANQERLSDRNVPRSEERDYRHWVDNHERSTRSRSSSPRRRYAGNHNSDLSPVRSTYERRRSRSVDRHYSQRIHRFPEDDPLNSSQKSKHNSPERHQKRGSLHEKTEHEYRPSSRYSTPQSLSLADPEDVLLVRRSSQTSSRSGREWSNDNSQIYNSSRSSITSNSKQRLPTKTGSPEEEKAILELKIKLDRIGDIVAFFDSNDSIRQSLRRLDIEQYEELIELTKTAD